MDDPLKLKFSKALRGRLELSDLFREFTVERFDEVGCLARAAIEENLSVVEALLDQGCKVDARKRTTALDAAVNAGNLELVELLLARGADANLPDQRLLFGAIRNVKGNGLAIARILVKHGIDVNRTFETWDGVEQTALDWAEQCPEFESFLRSVGAKTAEELGRQPASPREENDEVGTFMSELYGPIDMNAIVEIVSEDPPISIRIIRPNSKSECLTLFTVGMSFAPMSVKKKDKDYAHAELFIQLPSSWPTDSNSLGDANHRWPIEWIKNIARYPHRNNTSLKGPFTIITNADSDRSISPNNSFTAMLVVAEHEVERDGETVHLYRLTPLYKEEVDLHREKGMKGLAEAFDDRGVSRIVDIGRPNAAQSN